MRTLDTNILARLLLADDAGQCARAKALLAQKQVFTAPVTVMLELVWVLEANERTPFHIRKALDLLLAVPNFQPQEPDSLRQALAWYAQGMDFADALHLALSTRQEQLLTFDKRFIKAAARLGLPDWVAGVPG